MLLIFLSAICMGICRTYNGSIATSGVTGWYAEHSSVCGDERGVHSTSGC
jgi:hypothetical protein